MNSVKHLLLLAIAHTALAAAFGDEVDDYIRSEMEKQRIPGLSLAVLKNGELLKRAEYGLANVELDHPVRPETVFQVQSITKTFTATGVMLLVEEGRIGLDENITAYLDGLPECWSAVTVRHLLTHTSGIKDFINEPTVDLRKEVTPEGVIQSLLELPLNFEPGEKYAYSNTGYHLLGMIIHKVTGSLWNEFLQERIFDPLEMRDTRVISLSEIIAQRASGYFWVNDTLQNGRFIAPSILGYAGGGLRSTAADLARWDAALCSEKIVPQSVLQQMWTPARLNDGSTAGYGLGWSIGEFQGRKMVSHSGAHATGFKTILARFVEDQLTVIVLTNQRAADQRKICQEIASRYLDREIVTKAD